MTDDARDPEDTSPAQDASDAQEDAVGTAEKRQAGRPGRGRRIAVISGTALVTAAAVGLSGFTVLTVRDADRDPGKPAWQHAQAADGPKRTTEEPDGLRGMLLPWDYRESLQEGPDIEEYGSDGELSGKEATELAKEGFKDLPRSQRKQIERAIDKRRVKGIALRSYTVQGRVGPYAVETVLTQVSSEKDARSAAVAERRIFQDLTEMDVFSAGPKVPGQAKNAWCYLLEAEKKGQNEIMRCVGHHGEVTVTLTAYAPRPIEKKDIAGLMGKQLDRIETPGEAV
ncbi:hypothetical protein [Streptomyces sp. NPDC002640]